MLQAYGCWALIGIDIDIRIGIDISIGEAQVRERESLCFDGIFLSFSLASRW